LGATIVTRQRWPRVLLVDGLCAALAATSTAFRELLDIDLVAPFALSTHAAQVMREGEYGRIIMMASIQGLLGRAGDAAYISAKGGMIALTRALAAEYGPNGVTCNAILPGSFATETNLEIASSDAGRKGARRRAFLRRWGQPHEVAGAAVVLASEAASYVTGASIVVDGGWSVSL
jgi:gluconate 5-dehydrogenase